MTRMNELLSGQPPSEVGKKLVPLKISKEQKRYLSRMKLLAGFPAARLLRDGAKNITNINLLPQSNGPFPEEFNLKISAETIRRLDEIAADCNISRAEAIRRIWDEAYRLWQEKERLLRNFKCPFDDIFL